jgi:hypothetical protein
MRGGDYLKTIISFLESLGLRGKKVGNQIVYYSPFRDEETPSFFVDPVKDVWYDFGAGEGGDLIKLVSILYSIPFKEAMRKLGIKQITKPAPKSKEDKKLVKDIEGAKRLYDAIKETKNEKFIKKYFERKGVIYHPEAGIAEYKSTTGQRWVVFPCPNPQELRGLECRGINDDATETIREGRKVRVTRGEKYPWILYRGKTFLLTESIIDSLAGEVLLNLKSESLLGLNGVGNVRYLPEIIEKYKPGKFLIALDNDSNHNAGQLAQQKAIKLITDKGIKIELITVHKDRGVKDLYQVLTKEVLT